MHNCFPFPPSRHFAARCEAAEKSGQPDNFPDMGVHPVIWLLFWHKGKLIFEKKNVVDGKDVGS